MNNLIILNIRQQRKKLDNIKTSRLLLFVPRKDSGLQCLLLKKPWPNSKHRRSTRSIFVFDVWELLVTSSNRGVSISLGCSRRSGDPPVVYLISADLGGSQTFFALHLPRSTKPFLFRIFGFVSIYRRSFKDKFVTIRAIGAHQFRNRVYIANAQLRLHENRGFSRILGA